MSNTFLTTEQLAERIHYEPRTIRHQLVDKCLFEGRHYVRPFGGRKYLFIWETIKEDLLASYSDSVAMPFQAEA